MSNVLEQANATVENYLFQEIAEARSKAEQCGCSGCVFDYNNLISFMETEARQFSQYKLPYPNDGRICKFVRAEFPGEIDL